MWLQVPEGCRVVGRFDWLVEGSRWLLMIGGGGCEWGRGRRRGREVERWSACMCACITIISQALWETNHLGSYFISVGFWFGSTSKVTNWGDRSDREVTTDVARKLFVTLNSTFLTLTTLSLCWKLVSRGIRRRSLKIITFKTRCRTHRAERTSGVWMNVVCC